MPVVLWGNRMRVLHIVFSILLLGSVAGCDKPTSQADVGADGKPALAVSLHKGVSGNFILRFTNQSATETIRILRPLDGSQECLVMPYYAFSIDDGTGTPVGSFPRCGNCGWPYGDTTWPDDYVINIAPDKTYEQSIYQPTFGPKEGEYPVIFEYIFTPESELLPTGEHRYPKGLWRGKVRSNSIPVQLTVWRPVVG